jgi:hypothetical protein
VYTPVKLQYEAEISTFLVTFELNIKQRNTRIIISPHSLKGHIPLKPPFIRNPQETKASK